MTEAELRLQDERLRAEVSMMISENEKLRAEVSKIVAETMKIRTENRWYPAVVGAAAMAGAMAAAAAVIKLFLV